MLSIFRLGLAVRPGSKLQTAAVNVLIRGRVKQGKAMEISTWITLGVIALVIVWSVVIYNQSCHYRTNIKTGSPKLKFNSSAATTSSQTLSRPPKAI